eukprot:jgi/Psemu1/13606/gm1.13606_g
MMKMNANNNNNSSTAAAAAAATGTSSNSSILLDPHFTTTANLISDVIYEALTKNNGRVLVWDNNHNNGNYGCWCTLTNQSQIYSKIEYIVREFLRGSYRSENQKRNQQTIESSTSIFRSNNNNNNGNGNQSVASFLLGATVGGSSQITNTATGRDYVAANANKRFKSNSNYSNYSNTPSSSDNDDDSASSSGCIIYERKAVQQNRYRLLIADILVPVWSPSSQYSGRYQFFTVTILGFIDDDDGNDNDD